MSSALIAGGFAILGAVLGSAATYIAKVRDDRLAARGAELLLFEQLRTARRTINSVLPDELRRLPPDEIHDASDRKIAEAQDQLRVTEQGNIERPERFESIVSVKRTDPLIEKAIELLRNQSWLEHIPAWPDSSDWKLDAWEQHARRLRFACEKIAGGSSPERSRC